MNTHEFPVGTRLLVTLMTTQTVPANTGWTAMTASVGGGAGANYAVPMITKSVETDTLFEIGIHEWSPTGQRVRLEGLVPDGKTAWIDTARVIVKEVLPALKKARK